MNVLFITHHDNYQGSSRSLMNLLEGLQRYDINPYIAIPRESLFTEALSKKDIPYEIIPIPWWMTTNSLPFQKKWKLIREIHHSAKLISALITRWNIDLVYTNSSITPVGRIAAGFQHIPHIWHIREFFDLYFDFQLLFPRFFFMRFLENSNAVICHSKAVKNHYFRKNLTHIHQIYNGCATREQFDYRLLVRGNDHRQAFYTFTMLSTITHKKGQEEAIRALGEIYRDGHKAKLVIAGNAKPDYLAHLKQLSQNLKISDQVKFTGLLDDPLPVFYNADCVLICSEHEALSRVGLEAMSTALPLIGRNSGGNPEIIVPGETGFLYNTPDELVEYMTRLVQNTDEGRQMGLAGWQRAKEMFNIEDYAANVYKVIQSVMK